MKKTYFKKQNGFIGTDSLIAILLIMLFTGIIMTLSYNIYLTSNMIKRNGKASEYIVKIFEQTDRLYYDDVTVNNLELYKNGLSIPTGYEINIEVTTFAPSGSQNPLDLIKKVIVTVTYKLGKNEKQITMSKTKSREILITPNRPELSLLTNSLNIDENKLLPIKQISDTIWEVTNQNDTTWYNYENGNWAVVLDCSNYVGELKIGDQISKDQISTIGTTYVWIPRYEYYEYNELNNIEFLYNTTNQYVFKQDNKYTKLQQLSSDYQVLTKFNASSTGVKGVWLTEEEITNAISGSDVYEVYSHLNESIYVRNNNFGNSM